MTGTLPGWGIPLDYCSNVPSYVIIYVRVRTYKTVKISGKNTKIYSDWSKAKTVTTKK